MEMKECNRCGYWCNITSFKKTNGRWRINTCRWCKNEERKSRWHDIEKHGEVAENNRERIKQWGKENKHRKDEANRTWRNSTDKGYWGNKLTSIKAGCRQRGMDCTLTRKDLSDLYDKQNGKCAVTGRDLLKIRKKPELDTCSVDRIDNSRDYHIDNIRLITHQANLAKWCGNDEELLSFCKDVIAHLSTYD